MTIETMAFPVEPSVKVYRGTGMNREDTLRSLKPGDICKVYPREMSNGRIRCKIETKYSEFRKTYPSKLDYDLDWSPYISEEAEGEELLWN